MLWALCACTSFPRLRTSCRGLSLQGDCDCAECDLPHASGSYTGLATLSLRSDLWEGCERGGLAEPYFCFLDRLFVEGGYIYGYANETPRPIPGAHSLIGFGSRYGVARIVDFDYRNYIEDLYHHNFISMGHWSKLAGQGELLRSTDNVSCTDLFDRNRIQKGVRISLRRATPDSIRTIKDYLRPLLAG